MRHFDDLVLSYEVRAMKPQPEIFQAAVELCRMPARGVLLYGRHRGVHRGGAAAMGIDAVQFESRAQMEGEMRSAGNRWE